MKKIAALVGLLSTAAIVAVGYAQTVSVDDRPLLEQISGKPAKEQAQIVAKRIDQLNPVGAFKKNGLDVEILSVDDIDGGIAVTAKAVKNGKRIGFGDGTVEIERFLFFRPRISVPDPLGTIKTRYITKAGVEVSGSYREDPVEAVRIAVADSIRVVGRDGKNIINGKIGHTTATFYPDPHPESGSFDGWVYNSDPTWAATYGDADGEGKDDSGTQIVISVGRTTGSAEYWIVRPFLLFNTAPLTAAAVVTSATFTGKVQAKTEGNNDGYDTVNIYQSSPASNTEIALDDFDQVASVAGSDAIDITGVSVGSDADFAFNATALTNWLSKTGVTKLGMRFRDDVENHAYTGGGNTYNELYFYSADVALTTNDPKLTVVYSTPSPPKGIIIIQKIKQLAQL